MGNTSLDRYVISKGKRLPNGFNKYTSGKDCSQLCVFCNNPHDSIDVNIYSEGGLVEKSSGTFMCDNCFSTVRDMERVLETESAATFFDGDQQKMRKILLFVEDLLCEEDVNKHYLHTSRCAGTLYYRCYFCGQIGKDGLSPRRLYIPVPSSAKIEGGELSVCKACSTSINNLLPESSVEILYENAGVCTEQCPACLSQYLITARESHDRSILKSHGKHMCPRCTFVTLLKDELSPNRYWYSACEYCGADVDIDLTLIDSYRTLLYRSFSDKLMCPDCKQDTAGPLLVNSTGRYIWGIYPTGTNTYFRVIIRTITGRVIRDETVSGNIVNIVLNTYEDLIVNEPKQLSIQY